MVLYEWYAYCLSDFLEDIVLPFNKEPLSSQEYSLFKEDESESLLFSLETTMNRCEICYT
jgi:hypothetical protein